MGNFKALALFIVVAVIGVVGFFVFSNTGQAPSQTQTQTQTQPIAPERFLAYSDENLKQASAKGRSVIFFHASWCPLCTQAEADVKANWGKVPRDVTILKTDYDSSEKLKTTYGVVAQDTWVQVDEKGNEIAKWNSGGRGLSALLTNLK